MPDHERENFDAIGDFTSRWRETEPFGTTWPERNFFSANTTYNSKGRTAVDSCLVRLETTAGYSDGSVRLYDNERFSSEMYHLDFSVRYQRYEFDQVTGALVISGNSSKMGGDYSCAIIPIVTG
ncbi:hypothetical protein NKI94_30110 [Mesorhizobium australicum]|uniref:hypothetical protein n=1 Tax=Mesorhizobium australicum TaxID=536018 RepID=UPI00333D767F